MSSPIAPPPGAALRRKGRPPGPETTDSTSVPASAGSGGAFKTPQFHQTTQPLEAKTHPGQHATAPSSGSVSLPLPSVPRLARGIPERALAGMPSSILKTQGWRGRGRACRRRPEQFRLLLSHTGCTNSDRSVWHPEKESAQNELSVIFSYR